MRCANCEMPLSPTRSQCPRCGAPTPGKSDGKLKAAASQAGQASWQAVGVASDKINQSATPWASESSDASWERGWQSAEQPQGAIVEISPSSTEKAPSFYFMEPGNGQGLGWDSNKSASTQNAEAQVVPLASAGTFSYNPQRKAVFLTPRLGFTIAGACIAAGTLLLILVFIFARALPRTDTASANQQNTLVKQKAPMPTPALKPTVELSATSTPVLSGQKYFDGTQLGSTINNTTAQIITPATTFQLHQKIFVTFQVHTGGQVGAACLLWYWGDNSQTHFEFQLQGSDGVAYSYMPAEAAGAGKVEIYYASTPACTDKILAQTLTFSVGA